MILDPVGACIQPADLEPFPSDDPGAADETEKGSADPDSEEIKDDEEDTAEAVTKALNVKLSRDAAVPELVTAPVAAPIAV